MNLSEQHQQSSVIENASRDGDTDLADDPDSIEFVRRLQRHLAKLKLEPDCAASNDAVWDRFIREHAPLLLRLVKAYRWPGEECDDGVQDLWLTLIRRLKSFQPDPDRGAFEDWISVVAQHRLVDCDRCRKSHPVLRLGRLESDELPGREPGPVETFERKDDQELVRDAMDELRKQVTARDYEAFRLRWMEGWSVDKIAGHLGMTEGQIWSSHHRTRLKLRPLLARRLGARD